MIDRLLRETLEERTPDTPAMPCLDAESAAAFADDTLSRHERSRVEAHAAHCVRCQAWLAALEKTRPSTAPRAWWRRPVVWLAPIAAATALIVWINLRPGASVARSVVPAQTARNGGPPVAESTSRRDQAGSAGALPRRGPAAASATAPAEPPARTQRREQSIASSESRPSAQPRPLADGALAAASAPPQSAATPPPPAPPLPSRPLPQTITAPPLAGPVTEASRQNAAERAATPAPPADTLAVKRERVDRVEVRARALAQDTRIESQDARNRWRIIGPGLVQHAAEDGATWETQSTGVNVRLTAASSPSRAVCWVVGPAGTIVLTTDEGRTWQRLAFPEPVDLAAVRATDSDTAEIVTADARTFRTADRGRTWTR